MCISALQEQTQGLEQRHYRCQARGIPESTQQGMWGRHPPSLGCTVHTTRATGQSRPAHGIVSWLFTALRVSQITPPQRLDSWAESLWAWAGPLSCPLKSCPAVLCQAASSGSTAKRWQPCDQSLGPCTPGLSHPGVHQTPTGPKGYSRCAYVPQMCLL